MFQGLRNFFARRDVCGILIAFVLFDMGGCFLVSERTHTAFALGCVGTRSRLLVGGTWCFFPHRAIIARGALGVVVVDQYSDAGVAIQANTTGSPVPFAEGWVNHRTTSVGLLAPVFVRYSHHVWLNDYGVPLTPQETAAFRAGYAALMPAWGMTGHSGFDWPAHVIAGDGETWVLQPAAAVHDVIVVVLMIFALISLKSQRESFFAFLLSNFSRREARIRAGLCPDCAYDLRGSPWGCPECGLRSDPPTAEQEVPQDPQRGQAHPHAPPDKPASTVQ